MWGLVYFVGPSIKGGVAKVPPGAWPLLTQRLDPCLSLKLLLSLVLFYLLLRHQPFQEVLPFETFLLWIVVRLCLFILRLLISCSVASLSISVDFRVPYDTLLSPELLSPTSRQGTVLKGKSSLGQLGLTQMVQ